MENETDFKFKVGDKIVFLEMDYFKNPFHYKLCASEMTVLYADKYHFSPYYDTINKPVSGSNEWSVFHQVSGRQMYGNKTAYHKDKDGEIINQIILKTISQYDSECSNNDALRIEELKKNIESSEKEINEINKGEGSWKKGFTWYKNNEYKNKVLSEISKVFNIKTEHDTINR